MKLWQSDIKLDDPIEAFTVGDDYILDQKLIKYDCIASIAHARMLGAIGILKDEEVEKLEQELNHIIDLDKKGKFTIRKEHEDSHTEIENHLVEKLGNVGKKIHTARSRNDQVLTALRLFYKDELNECKKLLDKLAESIADFGSNYGNTNFPGYTHTRKAMPTTIAMWSSSFVDSLHDDFQALGFALELVDQSPLGTGAGYGIPLEIRRDLTAKFLGFKKIQENPIYAQNSRGKFESSMLHALSQVMFDLNKMASDLIIFSMPEFGYFELPEKFCTGSSIMPQKKNPDVLELLRAKYHVVVSCEIQIKNLIGNLISGYHRDFQLTKKATFEALEITKTSVQTMSLIFQNLKVNREKCAQALTEEVYATEEVYKLVKEGMPFREAYQAVAKKY